MKNKKIYSRGFKRTERTQTTPTVHYIKERFLCQINNIKKRRKRIPLCVVRGLFCERSR